MVLGWRRAFCTSVSKDRESKELHKEKQQDQSTTSSSNPSPRFGSRFRFFSNPSTPRLQSQLVPPSPSLRCRTSATVATPPDQSPKLQCKTKNSPRFFFSRSSTPLSSPRSPSTFSLLKSTLRLSRVRCGICLQSVKAGEGKAIFTAECSHVFHFPCIASHLKKPDSLVCPVCGYHWKQLPILTSHQNNHHHQKPDLKESAVPAVDARTKKNSNERKQQYPTRPDLNLKVYNDDEPLMSPKSVTRFYPIPESDENEDDDDDDDEKGIGIEEDFKGFFVNPNNASPVKQQQAFGCGNVEVMLLPDAAVVSVGRSHETYAVVLKVRAPPAPAKNARRVPIDLVTVLDVGGNMSSEKVQMLKRAMRLVVSSLSSSDRLSIVAFAATSKRLLPLRRMTANGRVSARRIIDAIVSTQNETITSSAGDAVKKAAKVLEDRRERNPVASILLLSQSQSEKTSTRVKSITTRFAHLEIPVHSVEFGQGCSGAYNSDDAFAKCVDGLLSVVVQDLRLQLGFLSGSSPVEISAVYSCSGRPSSIEPGSIRIGDLYGEEEREFLIELKVSSSSSNRAHHVLSVRCCHKDISTQELVYSRDLPLLVPRPHAVRSSSTNPTVERLRSLFFTTRAVAESRLLIERNNFTEAHQMLTSARALLVQSRSASADEFIRGLDVELTELQWRRQKLTVQTQTQTEEVQRRRGNVTEREAAVFLDEKGEPLTPTSAWRAAERLAKVAIMRKSVNRVSDLHGFENARF